MLLVMALIGLGLYWASPKLLLFSTTQKAPPSTKQRDGPESCLQSEWALPGGAAQHLPRPPHLPYPATGSDPKNSPQ